MSIRQHAESSPRVIPEKSGGQLKAALRKAESEDSLREIGECLDFARREVGWNLDELAGQLPAPAGSEKRDPRQVQRWIDGKEHVQLGVVFQVKALRAPFVVALSRLAADDFDEETVIRRKRRA